MKVGIDLGTTNSALAWIDPAEAEDTSFPPIHIFDIPQLVAPNRVEPRRTLPSFLFLEGAEASRSGLTPANRAPSFPRAWFTARNHGSRTPTSIALRRSCLGMRAKAAAFCPPSKSPHVSSSAIREAWDKLREQPVRWPSRTWSSPFRPHSTKKPGNLPSRPRTTPACRSLTLIEEPAAAFYSWIANNFTRSRKLLFDGQIVLVCDVGGGTSDFSLIRVSRDGDKIDFTRTAVGKHLLLGGDNLDLTLGLARRIETRQAAFDPAAQRFAAPVLGGKRDSALRSAIAKASRSACSAADRP